MFDLNQDNSVDDDDVDALLINVIGTRRGDANLDLHVDFDDFQILAANFGEASGWSEADFNGDGTVDFDDFIFIADNFGFASA